MNYLETKNKILELKNELNALNENQFIEFQNLKNEITQLQLDCYKSLTPWDTCTTGRHLHLSIARGLYMKEYTSWSTYTAKLVNPVSVINFPKKGVWFSNRTTKY